MPRPEKKFVTFELDGQEVTAPEGSMLVDGAKYGDVEIPVFCYEPKLGAPVGACRMCLVEIEGIPKLQTACSTPVKDGMVVNTTSDRVKHAQEAVVEFLLVNHPLDCPVCDKGGECPLQDIAFGWGPGKSRFIEPKRHFQKPLELSPLVAIDRERCILCYRCVRFSQEIAEDYQLVFLERGDHTYVGTHNGHPYVGPFSGNIIELCPVGALTSQAYRFRARPWDIEGAGSLCTLCPSQCNVNFTIRDDAKVLRVLSRMNEDVDDGWLCDKGRFGYEAIHSSERVTKPMVRDGGVLRPVSWERALREAGSALDKAGQKTAALVGGESTNEEGYLMELLMRNTLGSPHIDSRIGGPIDRDQARILARPDLSTPIWEVDNAAAVLVLGTELIDESPIFDLRVRKAARRHGTQVIVANSRPGALDANAAATLRYAPGAAEATLAALSTALTDSSADLTDLAGRSGAEVADIRAAAEALSGVEGNIVVLWGERISHGDRGKQTVDQLLALARALNLSGVDGSGLIEVPAAANGRGLREVGCLPNMRPGFEPTLEGDGLSAPEIAKAIGEDITTLILFNADPLRDYPDAASWESALDRATNVIAFADFLNPGLEQHANVVFPAEAYAEKDGTVTHPDGRVQRLRQAVARPGEVRPERVVLLDLISSLLDQPLQIGSSKILTEQCFAAVPFYDGLTLEKLGGTGVRWQENGAASKLDAPDLPDGSTPLETPPALDATPGSFKLGTAPSLWSSRVTEHAPHLKFLTPQQRAELSPEDAKRLGITSGDRIEVAQNGTSVRAVAQLRARVAPGNVFLIEGTPEDNANALSNGKPQTVEVRKAERGRVSDEVPRR